jgi:hypothetical protein
MHLPCTLGLKLLFFRAASRNDRLLWIDKANYRFGVHYEKLGMTRHRLAILGEPEPRAARVNARALGAARVAPSSALKSFLWATLGPVRAGSTRRASQAVQPCDSHVHLHTEPLADRFLHRCPHATVS